MGFFSQESYSKEKFANIVLEGEEISGIGFENCVFSSCHFIACRFKQCKFINCEFSKSDISASKIMGSLFLNVVFEESKAMSIDWTNAASAKTLGVKIDFNKTNINYSSFAGLDMKKIECIDCIANEVDFSDADLEEANFAGTDLKDAIFSRTNLKKANFVKAYNYVINLSTSNVKKAKFSLPDAMILLRPFEVVVIDEYGEEVIH